MKEATGSQDRGLIRTTVPVQGMHCTNCAQTIELTLARAEGVSEIQVSYPTAQAEIEFDPGQISLQRIDGLIQDLGFAIPTEKVRMRATGMSCAGCADAIRHALERTPGVLSARVNLAQEEAEVTFMPEQVSLSALQTRVDDAGYGLLPLADPTPSAVTDAPVPEAEQAVGRQPAAAAWDGRRVRLVTALVCSVTIFLINMVLPRFLSLPTVVMDWVVCLLTALVLFWVGAEYHRRAWRSLRNRFPGMDLLVSLGSNVAFFSSFAFLLLDLDRSHFPLFFESASFIITFIYLGRYLEARARRQTGDAIQGLMALQPAAAHAVRGDRVELVPLEEIKPGDVLVVKAGDTVPVDGVVREGESAIDESMLSGESLPVLKQRGDEVWGGTLNQEGSFRMEAQAVGTDTAAARIAETVRNALMSKAPVQSLADRVARVFVPIIVTLAVTAGLIWAFAGASTHFPDLSPWSVALLFASAVLLISCPCALGLATPTAMVAGTALGARRGILVKDTTTLQRLSEVDTVVLDKTGTVTAGQAQVRDTVLHPEYDGDRNAPLRWAASALQGSAHPVSAAIRNAAGEADLSPSSRFRSWTGRGVEAMVDDARILVGSPTFMAEQGVSDAGLESRMEAARAQGHNVTLVARGQRLLGFFVIADTLRENARELVHALRQRGLRLRLFTGDHRATAQSTAAQMDLDPATEVESQMKPEDKARAVQHLQDQGHVVCMTGDGVNDAPALAQADVSLAMVSGHNLALETADAGILANDLSRIPEALGLGRRTMRVVRQNLFWAFFYNVAAIPLAAGVFVPFLGAGAKLDPRWAAAIMVVSSLFVVQNSLRIRRFRLS